HLRQGKSVVAIRIPLVVAKMFASINLMGARALGYAPMLSPGKIRELRHTNWVCDNTALNNATGWTPRILLAEGLQRTLRWNGASHNYNCT
ncbi:MAG: hypothetical protein AB1Z29_06190, partial [Desulfobacterales bacterium]